MKISKIGDKNTKNTPMSQTTVFSINKIHRGDDTKGLRLLHTKCVLGHLTAPETPFTITDNLEVAHFLQRLAGCANVWQYILYTTTSVSFCAQNWVKHHEFRWGESVRKCEYYVHTQLIVMRLHIHAKDTEFLQRYQGGSMMQWGADH